jgi:hypothetical protein
MKHLNPEVRRPVSAAIGVSGLMHTGNVRFIAGLAVTGGGAAILLSDLIARVGAWG